MLRLTPCLRTQLQRSIRNRTYASAAQPNSLVYLEHHEGDIDSGSLAAVTAATELGGNVTGIVVGKEGDVDAVLEKARK